MDERTAKLEAVSDSTVAPLAGFNDVDRRFSDQGEQIGELRSELRTLTRWLIGSQITIVLFMPGLSAKVLVSP